MSENSPIGVGMRKGLLIAVGIALTSLPGCLTTRFATRNQQVVETEEAEEGSVFGIIPKLGLVRSSNPPRVPDASGYHAIQRVGPSRSLAGASVNTTRELAAASTGNINPLPAPPEITATPIDYQTP